MARFVVGVALAGALCASGAAWAQGYSVVSSGSPSGRPSLTPPSGAPVPAAPRVRIEMSRGDPVGRGPYEYGGVAPGGAALPPGFSRRWRAVVRHARGATVVAWPGFQMTPGGSRLFLAVTAPPRFTLERAPGRFVLRVRNARIHLHNNTRALETEAFNTPIQRAYLRTRGRDTELVVELRAAAEPRVSESTDGDGLRFVFVDFPAWALPGGPRPGLLGTGVRPADNTQTLTDPNGEPSGVDGETPPPVQQGP